MQMIKLVVALAFLCSTCTAWEELFLEHVKQYRLDYDEEEFAFRYDIFKQNMELIEAHNAQSRTYTMGRGPFTHMTNQEFNEFATRGRPKNKDASLRAIDSMMPTHTATSVDGLPTSLDWRDVTGVITPVKNQGHCGSCWSFGASGAHEAAYAINNPNVTAYSPKYESTSTGFFGFSEQNYVSCDIVGDSGCEGGWASNAFVFAAQQGGVPSEKTYSYEQIDGFNTTNPNGVCDTSKQTPFVPGAALNRDKPYTRVTWFDVPSLTSAVVRQPVTISVQAGPSYSGGPLPFMHYSGGIVTLADGCAQDTDHSVLLVGYNVDPDTNMEYWIVKNSWTDSWGIDGYIYIQKSQDDACGVLTDPIYPNMADEIMLKQSTAPTAAPTMPSAANAVFVPSFIAAADDMYTELQMSLTSVESFRVDSARFYINDPDYLSEPMWLTVTPVMFVNHPSLDYYPPEKNQNYFGLGAVVPAKDGKSSNTYVSVVSVGYANSTVQLRVISGLRYVGYDLPLNLETLLSYTSPAGMPKNVNSATVPLTSTAGNVGLGLTNLTCSTQSTWPTAAPSPPPPPTPPIPTGSYIMSTSLLTKYLDSDCSTLDPKAILEVSATTYGLCVPNSSCKDNTGCYSRTVTGPPLQTNPSDPITIPVYSGIYNDTACTIKVEERPPGTMQSNYCREEQPGIFVKFSFVEQPAGSVNVAPAADLVNAGLSPVYAYMYGEASDCGQHSLSNVVSYVAAPAKTDCRYLDTEKASYKFSCAQGTVDIQAYESQDCSGNPVRTTPIITKEDCGASNKWSTTCPSAPELNRYCSLLGMMTQCCWIPQSENSGPWCEV